MYIIKRAFKSIAENRLRYIIFGILLIIIMIAGSWACCVYIVAKDAVDFEKEKAECYVYVCDFENPLGELEINQISNLKSVESIQRRFRVSCFSRSISLDGRDFTTDSFIGETSDSYDYKNLTRAIGIIEAYPAFNLLGVNFSEDSELNYSNTSALVEGRYPEASGEAVLEQRFLELFDTKLTVGSTVTVTIGELSSSFVITGIVGGVNIYSFDTVAHEENMILCFMYTMMDDAKYFGDEANYSSYMGSDYLRVCDFCRYETLFVLGKAAYAEKFRNDLEDLNETIDALHRAEDPEYTYLSTLTAYNKYELSQKVSKLYDSSLETGRFMMLATLLAGAVIVFVFGIFMMNERRYEIGVLLSIGYGKVKIALLFSLEFLIFITLTAAVGLCAGVLLLPLAAVTGMSEMAAAPPYLTIAAYIFIGVAALSLICTTMCSIITTRFKPMTIFQN